MLLAACAARAQPGVIELFLQGTEQRVRDYVKGQSCVIGVAFIDLATGRAYSVNGDVLFPQASAIKIPILMRVFQAEREGRLKLADPVQFRPADVVGGSGNLRERIAAGPLQMPLLDVLDAMIQHSDNSATNKCIALVGLDSVNRMLDQMGFVHTRLRRVMQDRKAIEGGLENLSTPNEMARIAQRLWQGRIVDEAACREMMELMKKVKGPMRAALPASVPAATKTGSTPGVSCQSGVILLPDRPFALSVMTTFNHAGREPITDLTRIVYESFALLARSNEWGGSIRPPIADTPANPAAQGGREQ